MDVEFLKEQIMEMLEDTSKAKLEFVYWFLLQACMHAT